MLGKQTFNRLSVIKNILRPFGGSPDELVQKAIAEAFPANPYLPWYVNQDIKVSGNELSSPNEGRIKRLVKAVGKIGLKKGDDYLASSNQDAPKEAFRQYKMVFTDQAAGKFTNYIRDLVDIERAKQSAKQLPPAPTTTLEPLIKKNFPDNRPFGDFSKEEAINQLEKAFPASKDDKFSTIGNIVFTTDPHRLDQIVELANSFKDANFIIKNNKGVYSVNFDKPTAQQFMEEVVNINKAAKTNSAISIDDRPPFRGGARFPFLPTTQIKKYSTLSNKPHVSFGGVQSYMIEEHLKESLRLLHADITADDCTITLTSQPHGVHDAALQSAAIKKFIRNTVGYGSDIKIELDGDTTKVELSYDDARRLAHKIEQAANQTRGK